MQKLVWRNSNGDEIDLTKAPYGITNWEGFSNTSLNIQSQQVPFQDGGVFLDALMEQRELSVTLAIYDGNDLEKRYQYRRELIHILNPKLGEGYLIYTNNFTSKRIKCVAQIPLFETHNSNDRGTPKASLAWTACEPYWEDLEETEVEFEINEPCVVENNGDVKTQLKIELEGQVVSPVISNITTKQKIEIAKEVLNSVNINTNLGEKTVTENLFSYVIQHFGGKINDFIYVEKHNKYYFATDSAGILVYDVESDTFSGVTVPTNVLYYQYFGIAYSEEDDIVVAVGKGTACLYTKDEGKTWNGCSQAISHNVDAYGVVYDENSKKYFIVCGGGYVAYTDNRFGVWTEVQNSNSNDLVSVCKTRSYIYAVGKNGTVVYLGTNSVWSISSGVTSDFKKIISANNMGGLAESAIAVGDDGTAVQIDNTRVIVLDSGTTENLNSCCFDGNRVIAVGDNGTIISFDAGFDCSAIETEITEDLMYINYFYNFNNYVYGYAGIILKTKDFSSNDVLIQGVADNINKVIKLQSDVIFGVGDNGLIFKFENNLLTKIASGTTENLNSICYSSELQLFVVVGNHIILYSADGTTWQSVSSDYELKDIVYSNNLSKFVAVGGRYIISSIDGVSWSLVYTVESGSPILNYIAYSEELEKFLVTGFDAIGSSTDGIDWYFEAGFTIGTVYECATFDNVSQYFYYTYNFRGDPALRKGKGEPSFSYDKSVCDFGNFGSGYYVKCIFIDGKHIFVSMDNGDVFYVYDYCIAVKIVSLGIPLKSCAKIGNDVTFFGDGGTIAVIKTYTVNNIIDKITSNSDMNMYLEVGQNNFELLRKSGNVKAKLTYRQKYVGV